MSSSRRTSACMLCYVHAFRRYLAEQRLVLSVAVSLSAVLSQPLQAHEFKAGEIEIGHPWSRAVPQGATVAVGYLSLSNEGTTPDRLVSATAEIAEKAELHAMAVSGEGVMTMRPLPEGLEIPADGAVALEPGSYHLMFKGLKAPPREGQTFKGTLTFAKAGTVAVEFSVDVIGGSHDGMTEGE